MCPFGGHITRAEDESVKAIRQLSRVNGELFRQSRGGHCLPDDRTLVRRIGVEMWIDPHEVSLFREIYLWPPDS
jgi:hypothetical protein